MLTLLHGQKNYLHSEKTKRHQYHNAKMKTCMFDVRETHAFDKKYLSEN